MKRIICLLGLVVFGTVNLSAQGRINFNNSSATPIRISNGSVTQILGTASTATFGIGPASARIQLFAGLSSDSLMPVSVGTCTCLPYVTNTASALALAQGTFSGGFNLVLPFDGTQPVYLQMRADTINGMYTSFSPIIRVNLATNVASATTVFGVPAGSNQWDGLTIGPLPFYPWIVQQPQSQTVTLGSNFVLNVSVASSGPASYQWQHFGTNMVGATNSSYSVTGASLADAGPYQVQVDVTGPIVAQLLSSVATITIDAPIQFVQQPQSQIVPLHGNATFTALASGPPPLTYQWRFNGNPIPGATATNLVIPDVITNLLGDYSVTVSNSLHVVTSSVASLYMSPSLRSPFVGATVIWGKEALLSVGAQGSGDLSYQWYKDGQLVADATNATLVFPSVQGTNGGLYSVVVTSPYGSITNAPAQLVINPANISLGFYAGITIDGVPGYTYGIEYSTNLADLDGWYAITNVTLTQPVELWLDTSIKALAPGNNGRYYRVTAP